MSDEIKREDALSAKLAEQDAEMKRLGVKERHYLVKDESKTPEEPTSKKPSKEEAVEASKPEAEEAEEEIEVEDNIEDSDEEVARPLKTVPAWEYEKLKNQSSKREEELEAQIRSLSKKEVAEVKSSSTDEKLKKLAEKTGTDVQVLLELREALREGLEPNKALETELAELKKQRAIEADRIRFEQEYTALVAKSPEAGDPKVKEKIYELAYLKRYHTYPLEDLFQLRKNDLISSKKKGAESSKGSGRTAFKNIEEASAEDIANMSDAEYEEYRKHMSKGFKLTRTT